MRGDQFTAIKIGMLITLYLLDEVWIKLDPNDACLLSSECNFIFISTEVKWGIISHRRPSKIAFLQLDTASW